MIGLSLTGSPPYNYVSTGNGLNPISVQMELDYTDNTKYTNIITYLVANVNIYTGIVLQVVNEEPGINWFISYDNANWYKILNLIDMDARETDKIRPIFMRVGMMNDGTVMDGQYTRCDINIISTEIYK
jgi:hypothetical protein